MTENNKLQHEMTVDEALQSADVEILDMTFYAGKRGLLAALLVLTTEIRNRREPDQPPFLTFLEMTLDEALQYEVLHTSGATSYDGQRNLDVVLYLLAEEVRRLRKLDATADNQGKIAQGKNESKKSYKLADLLAQTEPDAPIPEDVKSWITMKPVGKERD